MVANAALRNLWDLKYVVAAEGAKPFGKAVRPAPVARIPLCRVRLPVTLPPIV